MRGAIPGSPTPHPLQGTLPGIYQGTSFLERFCGALDDVLAPVLGTLDNLPAYLSVSTAPDDFLPWLAYWTGMPLGPGQSAAARRHILRAASDQHGWQGTARGIALVVENVFGCPTTVEDSGEVTWSADSEAPLLPRQGRPTVVVRVRVPPGRNVDEQRLDTLVSSLTPVHVAYRVEVFDEG